jgi:hypothetical protein
MRYFDYSFLEHGMLPAGLVSAVGAITSPARVRECAQSNLARRFHASRKRRQGSERQRLK